MTPYRIVIFLSTLSMATGIIVAAIAIKYYIIPVKIQEVIDVFPCFVQNVTCRTFQDGNSSKLCSTLDRNESFMLDIHIVHRPQSDALTKSIQPHLMKPYQPIVKHVSKIGKMLLCHHGNGSRALNNPGQKVFVAHALFWPSMLFICGFIGSVFSCIKYELYKSEKTSVNLSRVIP